MAKNAPKPAPADAPPSAIAPAVPAPAPANRIVTPALVRVRVVGQPIAEDSGTYSKGDTFETTETRARALGSFVEPAS